MKTIPVVLPDEQMIELPPPERSWEGSLADWLAARKLRLNTRCGGRGLCRGCEVEVLSADGAKRETVKACQVSVATVLEEGAGGLRIPRFSYADQSLLGVSAFDVRIPLGAERSAHVGLGVAIDVGTTTLAAALWDLSSGSCLQTGTRANPQRRYGDDVLSRISFSLDHAAGLQQLQRTLLDEGLTPLLDELLAEAGHPSAEIAWVEIAGNPTMLQTLTGDSLTGLSRYPFSLAWTGERQLPAQAMGWSFPGQIHLLPALGPFVGADIVAGVLASGLLDEERTTLLIDFGTNGEMLLRHEGKCLATATAAGPAFEGGRLRCGTAARADVVSAITLSEDATWHLLGGDGQPLRQPQGLSGAAYIDFLSLAAEVGLLNHFGRFDHQHPLWQSSGRRENEESALYLDDHHFITEADVAELLQAKAALGAGIQVLLELAGIQQNDLERVLIAGGFGYHLRPDHAQRIGLLPDVPSSRLEIIGNSSLAGASLALQYDLRQKMIELSSMSRVIELNQIPSFADYYTDCLCLEPLA